MSTVELEFPDLVNKQLAGKVTIRADAGRVDRALDSSLRAGISKVKIGTIHGGAPGRSFHISLGRNVHSRACRQYTEIWK